MMVPMNSKFSHNDGQICYQVTGTGEPIVFIHGFTLDHRMWQPQFEHFSKNYQVITYDARGFGKSSLPTGPYSHADDLHALLTHLEIAQARIVGLSLGGRIAVNFTLAYPDMVRTLVLMDAGLDGYASTVDWNMRANQVGVKGAKENWLNHDLFAAAKQRPSVAAPLRAIVGDYSGWHWLHKDPHKPASTHARTRLAEIIKPTLIIVGDKDLSYFHDIADVLVKGITGARRVTIAKAGHMVNMEAPDEVNRLLAEFIATSRPI